jgi:hypothetical protein
LQKTGDSFTSKDLWNNAEKSVQFNTPVLKDGLLYGLTSGNELFCLSATDGATKWGAPAAKAAEGQPGGGPPGGGPGRGGGRGMGGGGGYGSVIDAGSVMLALTPSAELIVFQPGDKFAELARIKLAEGQTHAHPIASGKRIFVKDSTSVILWSVE